MDIFFLVYVLVFALLGVLIIRNHVVYEYRASLLRLVSNAARQDIIAGRPWRWRYDKFDEWSYNEMIYQFWRRPSKMYSSLDFTRF